MSRGSAMKQSPRSTNQPAEQSAVSAVGQHTPGHHGACAFAASAYSTVVIPFRSRSWTIRYAMQCPTIQTRWHINSSTSWGDGECRICERGRARLFACPERGCALMHLVTRGDVHCLIRPHALEPLRHSIRGCHFLRKARAPPHFADLIFLCAGSIGK